MPLNRSKMSFWDVKLRDVGEHTVKNFSFRSCGSAIGRAVSTYRAKYIICKNARIAPFFHVVGVVMVLNYMIEYKHLRAHESLRKYH